MIFEKDRGKAVYKTDFKNLEEFNLFFSSSYDELIESACPCYDDMLYAIAHSVEPKTTSVVDIGCGTANLLLKIIDNNKSIEKAIGVDVDAKTLDNAKKKMQAYSPIASQFIEGDFCETELPVADVCVSSLALHYESPKTQKMLLEKILSHYPVFINFDIYKCETEQEQEDKKDFISHHLEKGILKPCCLDFLSRTLKYDSNALSIDEARSACYNCGAYFKLLEKIPGFVVYKAVSLNL